MNIEQQIAHLQSKADKYSLEIDRLIEAENETRCPKRKEKLAQLIEHYDECFWGARTSIARLEGKLEVKSLIFSTARAFHEAQIL
jgi:hypothetical protein